MGKRQVYVTSLDCPSCKAEGRSTRLLRLNATPSKPPRGLLPAVARARYSVVYCVDCDGDLGAVAPSPSQRSS